MMKLGALVFSLGLATNFVCIYANYLSLFFLVCTLTEFGVIHMMSKVPSKPQILSLVDDLESN